MSLTVVGSIAFDSVRTPFGERERMLGGSAVHFSLAASFFTDVHVVGPVGDDFGESELAVLRERGIETARDSLVAAIGEVDCLMLNDAELRMLTREPNLTRAARAAMEIGPGLVVAKRGEFGAALFTPEGAFAIPGFLLDEVRDPTGAGDSFAGGFLGYLDGVDAESGGEAELRRAMAYGTVLASFNVEDFGTERVNH